MPTRLALGLVQPPRRSARSKTFASASWRCTRREPKSLFLLLFRGLTRLVLALVLERLLLQGPGAGPGPGQGQGQGLGQGLGQQ